jgi:hypothetical protein
VHRKQRPRPLRPRAVERALSILRALAGIAALFLAMVAIALLIAREV